ncbi:MAG: lysostaphin resistance A-like protein [Nannocystaceae bacterium]
MRDQHLHGPTLNGSPAHGSPDDGRTTGIVFEVGCLIWGLGIGWLVVLALAAVAPGLMEGGWLYLVSPLQLAVCGLVYAGTVRWVGVKAEPMPAHHLREGPRAEPRTRLESVGVWAAHVVAAVAGSVLLAALMELVGVEVDEQAKVLEAVGDGRVWTADLVALWIGAVALAPLAEEWVYRGLLFRRLRVWAPAWVAWSLPALIFAVSHGNWSGLAIYAWLGVVFANAYRMNGHLGSAVGVHAANNLLTLVQLMVVARMG